MAKFHLPIPLARLHPALTGSDLLFIREQKDSGKTDIQAFKALLAHLEIAIPPEIDSLYQ